MIDDDAQRPGGGTRIIGLDDGPDYRDPARAGPHDLRHALRRDAADGDHRARRGRDDAGEPASPSGGNPGLLADG